MMEELEQTMKRIGYEDLRSQRKKIDDLPLEDLRALLAYEFAKDGMELRDVIEVKEGLNNLYDTEEQIKEELINTFGY